MPPDVRNVLVWEALARDGQIPILLVRHGRTQWNLEQRFLGRADIPLDGVGLQQARCLAAWLAILPLRAIYTSPLARARVTAETIGAGRGLPIVQDADLAELDQGELEGRPPGFLAEHHPDFLAAWLADPADARVPGGETLRECQTRSHAAILGLCGRHPPGPPVVVLTHQMVLAGTICKALDLPLRHYRLISQRNTSVNLLSLRPGDDRLRLHRVHETGHLDDVAGPVGFAV